MNRILALALMTGLLAACNSGDSLLEWDPETQAMLDAQQAEAEAAAGGMTDEEVLAQAQADAQGGAADQSTDAPAATAPAAQGSQSPLALLDAQGTMLQGVVVRDAQATTRIDVVWDHGVNCSGGLVEESAGAGTFALNCSDGTIWLGKYTEAAPGQGAWSMRNARSEEARAVYGADAAEVGDATSFESVWSSRPTTPEGS